MHSWSSCSAVCRACSARSISAFALGEVTGVIAFLQNDTIAKATVLILIISAHPLPAPGSLRRKGARMSTPRQPASLQRATGFWQPELIGILVLIAAMYLMPYVLVDDFLISKYSRYLVFGLLAMALSLSWGYGGILNLGQALAVRSRFLLHGHGAQASNHSGSDWRRTACRTSWSGTTSSSCPGSGRRSIR